MIQRRIRLTLGYRGTRYAGWATQSRARRPTVQATVESALNSALGEPVRVTGAGRTDAGVHAEGQVVSFDTASPMGAAGLLRVLPHWLPGDIWLVDAEEAPADFDARRSARRRWYRYALWRQGHPGADWQGRCVCLPHQVDVQPMRAAAAALLGQHDFTAFLTRPSGATRPSAERPGHVRTVFAADWLEVSPSLLIFEICADAYLKQMVRSVVGSLLWVGEQRWTPHAFAAALNSADRRAAGPTAPAHGLTLYRIEY